MAKARKRSAAEAAAVTLGTALGTVAGRVDRWLAQRQDITKELNSVIDRAQSLLRSIGEGSVEVQKQASSAVGTAAKAAKRARRNTAKAAGAKTAGAKKAPKAADDTKS